MELDTRGQECPVPTIRAVEAMRRLREHDGQEEIVVITDDAVCAAEIPYQARTRGYSAASRSTGASEWTITLQSDVTQTGLAR